MNPKFFDLPQGRRMDIINAALNIFSRFEYSKASTEEIARRAGVSKSLLFHYFGSKRELYTYLYNYSVEYAARGISARHNYALTDFFELLRDAQEAKMAILAEHPDLMTFLIMAFYEEDPEVKDGLDKSYAELLTSTSSRMLERVDLSKFKPRVDPQMVLNIVVWMADGYMRTLPRARRDNLEDVNAEYLKYLDLLKSQFYKEGL